MRTTCIPLLCAIALLPAVAGAAPSIALDLVAGGFSSPMLVTNANDGSDRIFVAQRAGTIRIMQEGGLSIGDHPIFMTVPNVQTGNERGLLGMAFHPNYDGVTERRFYVHYSSNNGTFPSGWDHEAQVTEFVTQPGNPNLGDAGSGNVLLRIDQPAGNHNGGAIAFGPDGYLYIAVGDGGGGGDDDLGHTPGVGNGQDNTNILGDILRIDVDSGSPYGIPADNPFVDDGGDDEIFIMGVRNPFRMAFDVGPGGMFVTNNIFVGDVGQDTEEEVTIADVTDLADTSNMNNFGWRILEGNDCHNPSSGCTPPTDYIPPTHRYTHSGNPGVCAVTGGRPYRGMQWPGLEGYYFFGDNCSGQIWTLQETSPGTWASSSAQMLDTSLSIVQFGIDEQGEIYVVDLGGDIYRIRDSNPAPIPGDTPIVVDLGNWEYAPDIVDPFGTFPGDTITTAKSNDSDGDGSVNDLSIGSSNLQSGLAYAHWDSPPDLIPFVADSTFRTIWQVQTAGFGSAANVPQMRFRAGYGFTGGLGATDVVVPETGAVAPTIGGSGETIYELIFDELDVATANGTTTISLGTPFDGDTSTENAKRLFFDWVDFDDQRPLGGGTLEVESVTVQRFDTDDILSALTTEVDITNFTQGQEVDQFGGTLDTSPGSSLNVSFAPSGATISSTGTNTEGPVQIFGALTLKLDVAGVAALPVEPLFPSSDRIYRAQIGLSDISGSPNVPPLRVIVNAFDSNLSVNTLSTELIINALRGVLEGDGTPNPALAPQSFSAYLALPSNQPSLGGSAGDRIQASLSVIDQDDPYVGSGSVTIDNISIASMPSSLLP